MRDDRYLKDLSQKSHWTTRFSWCILLCSLHRCLTLNVLLQSTHSNEMSWWAPCLWFFSPLCDKNVLLQPSTLHSYLNPSWTVAWCCKSRLWLELVKLKWNHKFWVKNIKTPGSLWRTEFHHTKGFSLHVFTCKTGTCTRCCYAVLLYVSAKTVYFDRFWSTVHMDICSLSGVDRNASFYVYSDCCE